MRKVLIIFGQLSDSDVEWMATSGERVHVDKGSTLIPLASRIDTIYFVLDGKLAVKAANGTLIAHLESGEVLGEMSLVDPAPTAVSVEVVSDSTVLKIANDKVRDKLAADSAFASRFYRALCVFLADRLRQNTMRMGYGGAVDEHAKDELNDDLLDNVHLAGARFDRMLKRMAG
jgi:CRP/FNR family transcriptional regulator, cyclic AMP receptor protein